MQKYIITVVDGDGESVLAVTPPDTKYPVYDTSRVWSEYQKVLAEWLSENAVEIGQVNDEGKNIVFVVYRVKK